MTREEVNKDSIDRRGALRIMADRTLECGVEPIELCFSLIYDALGREPVACRVLPRINSVIYGVLTPERYGDAADMSETGVSFMLRILKKVSELSAWMKKNGGYRKCRFFVSAPTALIYSDDPYGILCGALGKATRAGRGISLELLPSVLTEDAERVARAFSDIRAAGFGVALDGYGSREMTMPDMVTATPDEVFMDGGMTALLSDSLRSAAAVAMVRYAAGLGARVIAEGAGDDTALRALSSSEAYGFIPSESYSGIEELRAGILSVTEFTDAMREGTT